MHLPLKTTEVRRKLAVTYSRLMDLIRHDRIPHPAKDASDDYIWFPADVERARVALANPPRRGRRPKKKEVASAS
jgi:hypothetical protein